MQDLAMNTILTGACPGACNAGARRRVRDYQQAVDTYHAAVERWHPPLLEPAAPEPPQITPVPGDPIYCPTCTWDTKARLSRLDGIAAVAAREADGHRGASGEAKVTSSRDPGSPSPTVEDLDELDDWLRSWKAAFLGVDGFARQGELLDSITFGTAWLVARVERVLRHPDMAVPFASEIHAWYARLRTFDPSDITVERVRGIRCPGCHRMTLERRAGDDTVRCRTAGCVRGESISWEQVRGMVEDALAARAS